MSRRFLVAFLLFWLLMGASAQAEKTKRVLLLGQKRDHPAGTHEYMSGLVVLAKCLQGVPTLETKVVRADDPWPEGPDLIAQCDGIVLYLGEGARWMQSDPKRQQAIDALAARGGGIVAVHWAIGARDARYIPAFLRWLGGIHGGPDRKYTFCETELQVAAPNHPIVRAIQGFRLKDEFYYRLKFASSGKVVPLLQARIEGQQETCAWAFERPGGGRSFGFCAMHNWRLVECRRLIAQGILWSVDLPIPPNGLSVEVTEEDLRIRP